MIRSLRWPHESEILRDLRRRVLYPNLLPAKAEYPGDDAPTTVHLGAFEGSVLVGAASLFAAENGSLQLRGMAILPAAQGKKVGAAIVRAAEEIAQKQSRPLWCNARLAAVGFYEKCGWRAEGEKFDVPDIGPHYQMRSAG